MTKQFLMVPILFVLNMHFAGGGPALCQPVGFFKTPTSLGDGVNSSAHEANAFCTPDGKTVFFASTRPRGDLDLWQATRAGPDDSFGNARDLGPGINTTDRETRPRVTPDGLTLFFCSDRNGGAGDVDLWVAARGSIEEDFQGAVNVATLNSAALDCGIGFSPDRLTAYFVSERPGRVGIRDLWTATRDTPVSIDFSTPVNLGTAINSTSAQMGPHVAQDGLALFFCDDYSNWRAGGHGQSDLWIATRQGHDEGFGNVQNLGAEINTSWHEAHPSVSPDWPADGATICFDSDRPGTRGGQDIWQATWVSLEHCVLPDKGGKGDCNGNGLADDCEIAKGATNDLDGNGLPDECPDCNGNGLADDTELQNGTSSDCDGNLVPDECEPDCNGNGIPDPCEVFDGLSPDCNGNLQPDGCEVALTPLLECPHLRSSDVGAVEIPGNARSEDGCLRVAGVAGNIGSRSDAFRFAYGKVEGDFRLTARVGDWSTDFSGAKLGLMIRESLEPGARHGAVILDGTSTTFRHRFLRREEVDGLTRAARHQSYDNPEVWLRIERRGTMISGQISLDAMTWTEPDTVELPELAVPVYVGIASSYTGTELTVATICDLTLEPLPEGPRFLRGECNDDGAVDVSDASCILNWQFLGEPAPGCLAATNTNGDKGIDIADAIYLLSSLFLGGLPPAEPFPACGPGTLPVDGQLGCETPPENCAQE